MSTFSQVLLRSNLELLEILPEDLLANSEWEQCVVRCKFTLMMIAEH